MSTFRNRAAAVAGALVATVTASAVGFAASDAYAQAPGGDGIRENPDFQFALLRYRGGNHDPRPNALSQLAWELRKRTSVGVDLEVAKVDAEEPALFQYPLIVWQGDSPFPPFSTTAVRNLRQHLTSGGTLLVDLSDGLENGGFHRSVLREMKRILPDRPWRRVATDHVLYKSFFLVDRHGGRSPTRPFLEGIFVEDRLAVVLSANDLGGAIARDSFGEWQYDVGAGGNAAREMTFRLGINVVMYALCLDYKEDQVHIPFILQRRR